MKAKKCEQCGADFGCGSDTGKCWCGDVPLTEETLRKLRELYGDCLCPDCLKALAKP